MLRDGLQAEMLLLIADNQPLQRPFLIDLFSGDGTQRHNTVYSLRVKGWIKQTPEGLMLTTTGEDTVKEVSEKQVKQQQPIKPKVVPAMLLRRPDPAKTNEYQTKMDLLKDLARPMAPEFQVWLSKIEQDVMKSHGVTA